MKLSDSYFFTLRENARDEDSQSSNLLVRAGCIKKTSTGIYMILPMGKRILRNIEAIVREEMNGHGGQEVEMPALIAEEVFIQSGRRDAFGANMFALPDRYGKRYVLGPTHEELFAMAAMMDGKSYRDFPYNLYQIQTKFRDETRPRFGLIRTREFTMKDAYSFDIDETGLEASYQNMADAYNRIFDRLGLDYKVVEADMGAMGGLLSEEYQALSDIGEDVLVLCEGDDYAANLEIAEFDYVSNPEPSPELEMEKIYTPDAGTIEEISAFLGKKPEDFVKTLLYQSDKGPLAFLLPGDRELNELKARKLTGAADLQLADPELVLELTGAPVGFAGPVGLDIPIYVDRQVLDKKNFIVGANEKDYHLKNVNLKDFSMEQSGDLSQVKEGDLCIHCHKPLVFQRGIEVGNLFKLGTKYSNSLDFMYLDQNNRLQPVWMGSYGIGIERCMAAIAEQNHDENGLIWPENVAPYQIGLVVIPKKGENQLEIAEGLYQSMEDLGYEVLFDDRNERPGIKFKDMELIGLPYRITVGKKAGEGLFEWVSRKSGLKEELTKEQLFDRIKKIEKPVRV